MIPTLQTKFGKEGNCLAACIATLYVVDIDKVPTASDHTWDKEMSEWFSAKFNKFMIPLRLHDLDYNIFGGSFIITIIDSDNPDVERHAVITKGDKIVFDPMKGVITKELKQESDPVYLVIGDMFKDK